MDGLLLGLALWWLAGSGPCDAPAAASPETRQLVALVNEERAASGVPTVAWDASLARAASWKAQDQVGRPLSHTDSQGRGAGALLRACGYADGNAAWGESLAAGQRTPAAALDAWRGSPPHAAMVRNPVYRAVGAGHAPGVWVLLMTDALLTPCNPDAVNGSESLPCVAPL